MRERSQRNQGTEHASKQGTETRQKLGTVKGTHIFRGDSGGGGDGGGGDGINVLPRAVNATHSLPPPLAASLPPSLIIRTSQKTNQTSTARAALEESHIQLRTRGEQGYGEYDGNIITIIIVITYSPLCCMTICC